MSKKLSNNGLWESSRMIIPQHRDAINRYQMDEKKYERPALDEQELELISAAIGESYSEHTEIGLILYDKYDDRTVKGLVVSVDQQLRRIKLQSGDDVYFVSIKDVIGIV